MTVNRHITGTTDPSGEFAETLYPLRRVRAEQRAGWIYVWGLTRGEWVDPDDFGSFYIWEPLTILHRSGKEA